MTRNAAPRRADHKQEKDPRGWSVIKKCKINNQAQGAEGWSARISWFSLHSQMKGFSAAIVGIF